MNEIHHDNFRSPFKKKKNISNGIDARLSIVKLLEFSLDCKLIDNTIMLQHLKLKKVKFKTNSDFQHSSQFTWTISDH